MAAVPFVCRHCGSTRSIVRYTFAGVDKVIRECTACRLMVLDPLPTEEELRQVYNDGYFVNEQLTQTDVSHVYGYVDYISERINKQKGYREILDTLRGMVGTAKPNPRLLDYGCGLGFFLDAAYEYGFDVTGVEFNDYAREYIRKRYRYKVLGPGEIDPADRYDVITMFDVIEHLREPFETLAQVREQLNENGILVLSTMDCTSLTSRLMGKRLEDFRRISEHLFFFDRSNLTSILTKQGFEVLKSASIGHSFELRLLAMRLRAVLPLFGAPLVWLVKLLPFAGGWSIYVNPRTKFIVYARRRS
jgi:2-polyprenyl-3-methyl-5-hydroxy-6-metoxy-1,4-benzoquinol methylase